MAKSMPEDQLAVVSKQRADLLSEMKALSVKRKNMLAEMRRQKQMLDENEKGFKEAEKDATREAAWAREIKAFTLRLQGLTYREIGEKLPTSNNPNGVSPHRASQIVAKARRRLLHPSRKDHPLRTAAEQMRLY